MSKRAFKPVVLEDPASEKLRPLFTGRIANFLDSLVNSASSLFGIFLVLSGVVILGYNLVIIVSALAAGSAWLTLTAVTLLVLTIGLFLWRSSLVTRMVAVVALCGISSVALPLIERFLK